jgi:20S proteasome subunit alpha 6
MFRSQYDSDVTIWSPQGRIHQLEYAMEAVKQGSACVGLKSKEYAVVATLKRSSSELGSYQKKIFKIDEHMGIAISGLTADARLLCKYMRQESMNHQFIYEKPIQISKLVAQVSDKSQIHTQRYGRRPYGVGLLVIGYDETGSHLYETSPSGNYYDFKAQAIGARSQSARTYLEKNYQQFENLPLDELIKHALLALRETTQSSSEPLNFKNCSIGIVGINQPFIILEESKIQPYLLKIESGEQAPTKMED